MLILDGKKLSEKISSDLKNKINKLKQLPKLVILQIGDNSASNVYIGRKVAFAKKIGALVEVKKIKENVLENEIIESISKLNLDQSVHGIIMQLPVPKDLNREKILNTILPKKDVDGLNSENLYKLLHNDKTGIIPATARGVVTLLKEHEIKISGKDVVIIGRSILVGKSVALNFLNNDATVTICHKATKNLKEIAKRADILVLATGCAELLNFDDLNENQVVVDIGINVLKDGKITGDLKHTGETVPFAVSPVPGGVGPMTVASLFQNLLDQI